MKIEIIDMHAHLLPGIDDGAKDMSDAIKALHMAEAQGVTKVIMTPHFYPDSTLRPEQVAKLTECLNAAAKSENIGIDIYPGMECMYFSGLSAMLEKGEAMPLAGSRYVLIEFLHDDSYIQIERGADSVFEAGFIPIIAHYERYEALTVKGRLSHLKESGCLLQMNYDTIQRRYNLFGSNPFYKDLKKGTVDFLGSDCHGSTFRKYFLEPSVAWLEKNLSEKAVYDLTYGNPGKILGSK